MAPRTPQVPVRPAVLRWARESAGYPEKAVARRIGVPQDRVETWEREPGPAFLTVRQMEELAHYYKRPTAALLLKKPPEEQPPPQDFRRPLHRDAPFSPDLRFAIRRAYRFQRLARDMMEALGLPHTSEIPQASPQEDPEAVARGQRQAIGVTVRRQLGWKNQWDALREWRDVLEERRLLLLQADFPRAEAQGFSVADSHPYTVVVTSKDPPTARCFTLFHEFAHLLLRDGGICLTEEAPPLNGNNLARTENWCHRFAEAFLVDGEALQDMPEAPVVVRQRPGYEDALQELASSFKVSQYVILFRLWHLDMIPEQRFWFEYNRVEEALAEAARQQREKKRERKGGPSPARQAVQERGRLFTRLVLEGLDREMLSYTEAIDYLGVRLKHLGKVRLEAHG